MEILGIVIRLICVLGIWAIGICMYRDIKNYRIAHMNDRIEAELEITEGEVYIAGLSYDGSDDEVEAE